MKLYTGTTARKSSYIPVLLQEKVAINRSVSFNLQQDVTGKVLPIY